MPFSEVTKQAVRRRADMRCSICRRVGIDIHHIVPQADGGPDTEDNAAPLCPSCHEDLGANPTKRKFIREARDYWYEVCDQRFTAGTQLDVLVKAAATAVTREDLASIKNEILQAIAEAVHSTKARPRSRTLGDVVRHLHDFVSPAPRNGRHQAQWLYEFIWSDSIGNTQADEIKKDFTDQFGTVAAKRLCHFVLQGHEYDILSGDGFTEPELSGLINGVIVTAVMLLHHTDLAGKTEGFELGIDPDGEIRAWVAAEAGTDAGEGSHRGGAS